MYEDHRVDCCEEIPGPRKVSTESQIPHLISTQLWLFFFSLPIIQFLNSLTDWHTICSTQLLLLLLLVLIYHCGSCQNDNCSCCNVNKSAAYSPLSLSLSLNRCHSLSLWVSFFYMVVVYSCFCLFFINSRISRATFFSVVFVVVFCFQLFCLFIAFFGCCFRCCSVAVAVVSCFLHLLFNNLHVVINKINTYSTRTHTHTHWGKETGTRTQYKCVENGKNVLRTAY